ncbi:MAG: methylenetetrahydrofolate reductase [Magnetococcales bacterium]|nr:methylenetetrahydrofolate reductase [Magnetococcales bacterium]
MKNAPLQQPVETRISVELVPRDAATLQGELRVVRERFAAVSMINVPDLPRFSLRAWEGCALAQPFFPHTVPHIRAIDLPANQPWDLVETLRAQAIREILVIAGDPHPDRPPPDNASTVLQAISRFKEAIPGIRVYAALDPYRQGFRQEYDSLQQKRAAGADGFFTQPFFDLRLMEIYAELLTGVPIFWGVSPVITDASRAYWEKNNKVVFPRHFEPTLAWNQAFARQALAFARSRQTHIYFMPIRMDVAVYLEGVLS